MPIVNVKMLQGVKISPEKAKTLDRAKMGVSITQEPAPGEVEGQWVGAGYTTCPWCGHVGRSVIDTDRFIWYTCGRCGGVFQA